MAGVEEWNRALLAQLLPAFPDTDPNRMVLLACDDEIVGACGREVRLDQAGAVADLIAAVAAAHTITFARGIAGVLADARSWNASDRSEIPPFLAFLCVTVLAASRMDLTVEHTSRAYYPQLTGLLGIEPRDEWPHIHRFDELPGLFSLLAGWLEREQRGARGRLRLLDDPQPRVVGVPISQTVLRGRDRRLLGEFFHVYGGALTAGWSPAYLLGRWAGRRQLTAPAQDRIADRQLRPLLNGTVLSAFRAWDGTRLSADGRVVLRALLRLGVRGGNAVLLVVAPDDQDRQLTRPASGPDSSVFALPAQPTEARVPWQWLPEATEKPMRLVDPARPGEVVEILPGTGTILFDRTAAGFEHVPVVAAGDPDRTVWVLTCSSELVALPVRRHPVGLPDGWALLIDVPVGLLPEDLTAPDGPPDNRDGDPPGVILTGGLTVSDRPVIYLADEPPVLVSRLDEPALVEIDGRDRGELLHRRVRALDELVGASGPHAIVCGDLDVEIELAERGLRDGVGRLVWDLSHRTLAQHGPVELGHHLSTGLPVVCGADVHAVDGLDGSVSSPVIREPNVTVTVLHADGMVTHHQPPPVDEWLRASGRAPDAWEVPDDAADAVWVLVRSRSRPRVLNVRDVGLSETDDVLDEVEEFSGAQLISAEELVIGRWRELIRRAAL